MSSSSAQTSCPITTYPNKPINEPTNQLASQPTSQPTNHFNQPTNQPTNHSTISTNQKYTNQPCQPTHLRPERRRHFLIHSGLGKCVLLDPTISTGSLRLRGLLRQSLSGRGAPCARGSRCLIIRVEVDAPSAQQHRPVPQPTTDLPDTDGSRPATASSVRDRQRCQRALRGHNPV